ncbi:copper homeostasis protein CutC [Devosia sp.]|uniref:copper homeostasis protein CutC n=1 Tax=Devosia sp. TaxID=1871048 RepID=UPI001AD48160|nr:copper homeostasis protein CutC [Devosia sp.]MBN9310045.1 copper homeostasis protein CutC [Devosia sp.]
MTTPLLEVCVPDAESLAAAVIGGAERVELCSGLELGGLTASPGLMRLAAAAPLRVYALVRPRTGDFVYDGRDIDALLADIDAIRAAGLDGIVIGASRPDGTLDASLLRRLKDAAGPLGTTLHRAIDLVPDFAAATEIAADLGFERILTSGGARAAIDGTRAIRIIHDTARGRIKVMAGSGLTPANVGTLLDAVPVDEVHSSCATAMTTRGADAVRLGFADPTRRQTDPAVVAEFREVLERFA